MLHSPVNRMAQAAYNRTVTVPDLPERVTCPRCGSTFLVAAAPEGAAQGKCGNGACRLPHWEASRLNHVAVGVHPTVAKARGLGGDQ